MIGLGGSIRTSKDTRVTVVRTESGIELGINSSTATVDFGDAEHIASLLIDLARIARFQGGISRIEVA
ncbi:hypothetical protein ACHIPZ_04930 [Antrihabitans sp. NCIMB 15449]|uniref:Uncharacterized protein n=1 Tax=Antrihabitans spumae TaxID=3373370 RepID=A0ABW7JIU6_9NOCA